jgi:hypothetical protein
MAVQTKPSAFQGIRKRDLIRALETDPRVREWLRDGAMMGVKQAAEFCGVERSRIWRWQQQGKIVPLFDSGATEVYMRADLERLMREDPPQRRHRRSDGAMDGATDAGRTRPRG